MRKSPHSPDLLESIQTELASMELWRCHQCGQCTGVCPSGKHGGIIPREVMERAAEEAFDLRDEKSIWLCVMCNSCSERCQLGVDPAFVITLLRQAAAQRGNRPQHFADEAKLFKSSGLSFPNTGMTRKLRKELGLPELCVCQTAICDVQSIIKRTGMGRAGIE
ncbi:MAG: 4Fe-4S dicluster domain-containing protein [Methanomassiliicoccales archaeon]|nr:4Fe-4S dicluster domain-containing protein [Methanomassiliicoccales archaeon]